MKAIAMAAAFFWAAEARAQGLGLRSVTVHATQAMGLRGVTIYAKQGT